MNGRGVLLVRTEGRRLGIPLVDVIEVSDVAAVQSVPGAHAALRGVLTARGRLVPLFHLGALLGARTCPAGAGAQTMVLASAAGRWIGLEVEDADAALNELILPHPDGWGTEGWTLGVLRRPDGWIPILNLGALAERWLPRKLPQ